MFGFGKKSIKEQWEDVASNEDNSTEESITGWAFSQTDEDDDSTSLPYGFVTLHDTSDWRLTKGQNN